jgi:methylated-DNA-protein-cysteine methyltransferase-like protein
MSLSNAGAPFRQRVYEIVRLVPYGMVTTYGFVALLCGLPRLARQVGWALHTLPEELVWGRDSDVRLGGQRRAGTGRRPPVVDAAREAQLGRVPWHRVINAQGRVSTHPDEYGTLRQIELLRSEGIDVTDDGTLVRGLAAHRWWPEPATVDAMALAPEVLYALELERDR